MKNKLRGLSTIMLFLSLSLLLFAPFNGWAANPPPPPPGTKVVGPSVAGTITFVDCGTGILNIYFSGKCRGESVTFSTTFLGNLDDITEANLEGASTGGLIDIIPVKCMPDASKGTVQYQIIDNVKRIDQLAPSVVAVDVSLMFIVVPPPK